MQAIILTAGLGERMGDLTKNRPKALVPVAGRELILRVMDFLDHPAITERIVVTGFESKKLESFLTGRFPAVRMVHNPHFTAGNILTMEAALPHIKDDFILMNVDHIYPRRILKRMIDGPDKISAVCDFDRQLVDDDMKVKMDDAGHLRRIGKTLDDFDGGYIGMTCCSADCIRNYREGFASALKDKGTTASVENVLGWITEKSMKVNICDTSGIRWLEIDTQEDLQHAERTLRINPDFLL